MYTFYLVTIMVAFVIVLVSVIGVYHVIIIISFVTFYYCY